MVYKKNEVEVASQTQLRLVTIGCNSIFKDFKVLNSIFVIISSLKYDLPLKFNDCISKH